MFGTLTQPERDMLQDVIPVGMQLSEHDRIRLKAAIIDANDGALL